MEFNEPSELAVARVAAAIGEPARTRILFCLMDGHARTSTELAIVAGISPSTASVHLHRLQAERLVKVIVQGKHRYYSLAGGSVATALEGLTVLAGTSRQKFVPNTPSRLHAARACYDHIAGTLGVLLHDRLKALGWVSVCETKRGEVYDLTGRGASALQSLGIDVEGTRRLRRRFAFGCLDWSERKPHLGGALAAAILDLGLKKRWLLQELDSRALSITPYGRRQFQSRFGLSL
jgi:DNA-binding transcriptional ArsR family regulator